MARILYFFAVGLCLLGAAWSDPDEDDYERRQAQIVNLIRHRYETDPEYARLYDQWVKEQNEIGDHIFPCPLLNKSSEVPTSVHKLRPSDIKVVGALGDSLTAGRGAKLGVIGLLYDFPGVSWSIGGKKSYKYQRTLPNILREYNPSVYGASMSRYKRVFNKAKTGAKSDFLLNETMSLVEAMRDDPNIDFENDWKVVTLFIGGNDLCAMCKNYSLYTAENYIDNVRESLDYLQDNLPRAFVNLVEVLNIEMVQELGKTFVCQAVHIYACNCAANPKNDAAEDKIIEYRRKYQEETRKLVASGRYDKSDNFTVVLQPFYENTYPPHNDDGTLDLSYFASDCFHQSVKGQEAAAKALWNNMIEPVGSKRLQWHPKEEMECPTEDRPYFCTAKNSVGE